MQRLEALQKKTDLPDLNSLYCNHKAQLYIRAADSYLESIGYTEHGQRHCRIVSEMAYHTLNKLGFSEHSAVLAAAAGYLHDIGNLMGRVMHQKMGALLAKEVLEDVGFPLDDIVRIMTAIVVHEETEGAIPDEVSAALIIADKSDVHRSRVRNPKSVSEDIHDRVNFAVTESDLLIDPAERTITLSLMIDTRISQVIEYFEIFLNRMMACRRAAKMLKARFFLYINNTRMA